MKKYLFIIIVSLTALSLTGCAMRQPDSVRIECKPDGPPKEQCKIIVDWVFNGSNASNLASLINETFYIGFGSGNRMPWDLIGNSTTITLKHDNQLVAARTAESQLSGSNIVPVDQAALSNWLGNYDGLANKITLVIDDVYFTFGAGSNTVVAEVVHNGDVLAGSTYSDYIAPPPGYWDEK